MKADGLKGSAVLINGREEVTLPFARAIDWRWQWLIGGKYEHTRGVVGCVSAGRWA